MFRLPTLTRSFSSTPPERAIHVSPIMADDDSPPSDGVRRLIWHRRDLRLHDNALYSNLHDSGASASCPSCLSLFVIDTRNFAPLPSTVLPTKWDAVRVGPHAARYLLQALSDLRTNLRSIGGELIIRIGDPVDIVPSIAREIGATEVHWNEIPGTEEIDESRRVFQEICFQVDGVRVVTDMGYSLYHPDDLPPGDDAGLWRSLAHPKQKQSKKKAKKTKGNAKKCDAKNNGSHWPEEYGTPQHKLVDISQKRFAGMCSVMGDYRRAVRTFAKVRPTLKPPAKLIVPASLSSDFDVGSIPTLNQLYAPLLKTIADTNSRSIMGLPANYIESAFDFARAQCEDKTLSGGEKFALKRLDDFIFSGRAATADRSLADVTTNNDSSKFSAHLAFGALSPRTIYERASEAGEEAKWLISHMEMRDYFISYSFQAGPRMFRLDGADPSLSHKKGRNLVWNDPSKHEGNWQCWAKGCTGFPLVDAAMKELLQTGYCSNRVRQNAASFLTKDLKLDWRAGADLFQFLLDDFCLSANWGNWAYFSGVGSDPKNRHFRSLSQALKYDLSGSYVRKWHCQHLRQVHDDEALFRPWDFDIEGWPKPLVDPKTQLTHHDLERFGETGKLKGM